MSQEPKWAKTAEKGTVAAMKFMVGFYHLLGRRLSVAFTFFITLYFFLTSPKARATSREYLNRLTQTPEGLAALGHTPTWKDSFWHLFEFALVLLDRLEVWTGRMEEFQFTYHGAENIFRILERKEGAIFLGSHFGSFDMLRAVADRSAVKINAVMFTQHARMINSVAKQLDPSVDINVINLLGDPTKSMFEIRECIKRGEIVAILGDRPGIGERAQPGKFLGGTAYFPEGPFQLACVLGCPVLLTMGIRTGTRKYETFADPFFDGGVIPRKDRARVIQEMIQDYASRLEKYCYRAPYQWFNFIDYWVPEETLSAGEES